MSIGSNPHRRRALSCILNFHIIKKIACHGKYNDVISLPVKLSVIYHNIILIARLHRMDKYDVWSMKAQLDGKRHEEWTGAQEMRTGKSKTNEHLNIIIRDASLRKFPLVFYNCCSSYLQFFARVEDPLNSHLLQYYQPKTHHVLRPYDCKL